MKHTTQQDKLETFLTKMAEINAKLHKEYWPDKEMIKVFTHRRWGNRYGRGYRFSQLITHTGAGLAHWQDITLRSREDLIRANQTMLKLGYEFKSHPWAGPRG